MQPCRITTRVIPRASRRVSIPNRTMFTGPLFSHVGGDFFPLLRAMDSVIGDSVPASPRQTCRRSCSPRFDVREIASSYELQGELPGMEQKDLDIEFVDERTLVIRGKSVRETASGHAESKESTSDIASEKPSDHRATVEDEYVDAGADVNETAKISTPARAEAVDASRIEAEEKPAIKYWVTERSVGDFERRFSFPGRVDQEAVKASLKNGILSVIVPKVIEKQARRIDIS